MTNRSNYCDDRHHRNDDWESTNDRSLIVREDTDQSKTRYSLTCDRSVMPGEVLLLRYPFQCTQPFYDAFCRDQRALPLPETRQMIWWELVGKPQWAKSISQAKRAHKEAMKRYHSVVARIARQNREIDRHNAAVQKSFKEQMAKYKTEFNAYRHRKAAANTFMNNIHTALDTAFQSEVPKVAQQIRNHVYQIHRQLFRLKRTVCWAVAMLCFAWTTWNAPLFMGVPGFAVLVCLYSIVDFTHKEFRRLALQDTVAYVLDEEWYERNKGVTNPKEFTVPLLIQERTRLRDCNTRRRHLPILTQLPGRRLCDDLSAWWILGSLVPGLSFFVVLRSLDWLLNGIPVDNADDQARSVLRRLANTLTTEFRQYVSYNSNVCQLVEGPLNPPVQPDEPQYLRSIVPPSPPSYIGPPKPSPPASCFDKSLPQQANNILKGIVLSCLEWNQFYGRELIFSDGHVHPYKIHGGVPVVLLEGQTANHALVGQQGSGKTVTILRDMSYSLPLTAQQIKRILKRTSVDEKPLPETPDEWSRSLTYQAVIYDAKDQFVPVLAAFGFNPNNGVDSDLIIFKPKDKRGFAWAISKDVTDRDSVSQFAAALLPHDSNLHKDHHSKFWRDAAQQLIEEVIISLQNISELRYGDVHHWTLMDIIIATESDTTLTEVLQFHDNPDAMYAKYFGMSKSQYSSVTISVRTYLRPFRSTAGLWLEAARQRRSIGLKEWATTRPNTVIVLPNAENNPTVYEPLNRAMVRILTNLFTTDEYSSYRDASGARRVRRRYVYLDEVGDAGHLPDLVRLLSKGRDFGVNVVLGVQQRSQLVAVYGEEDTDTILGQCGYMTFLKQKDPKTQKYASDYCGEQLVAYEKRSATETSSEVSGRTDTTNSSTSHAEGRNQSAAKSEGTNSSDQITAGRSSTMVGSTPQTTHNTQKTHTDSKSEQLTTTRGTTSQDSVTKGESTAVMHQSGESHAVTSSVDLRKEPAYYPGYFGNFPSPSKTGKVMSVDCGPDTPPWTSETTFDDLKPKFEDEAALRNVPPLVEWPNMRELERTTSWTPADRERLGLQPSTLLGKPNSKSAPHGHRRAKPKPQLPNVDQPPVTSHAEDTREPSIPNDFDFAPQ
jgi:hypothetical protein